jgi:hypothetical protein
VSVCRSCGATPLEPVVSLGAIPLVNALVEPGERSEEPRFPLDVDRCPNCSLCQLETTVPPEVLFRDYTYFSSYSDSFVAHARAFASDAIRDLRLDAGSFVVEAASNDGYLLRSFVEAGVPALGIEPAENVAAVARGRGIETLAVFLNREVAERIVSERGPADLVIANNVLAHVPDVNEFVAALGTLAGERGVVSVEVPYVRDMLERLEFDTIYHEHVFYFSLTALAELAARHDLNVTHVERLAVHGGSLRVSLSRRAATGPGVLELLAEEATWGVRDAEPYARFAEAVARLRGDVHELVADLASKGRVAAYGAAAKGVVLANTCGLDAALVRFVVDRNPVKQGRLLPGVRIPVLAPEALERERPDYCILFAWNIADEILSQQRAYRDRGGRFVQPIPAPTLLA